MINDVLSTISTKEVREISKVTYADKFKKYIFVCSPLREYGKYTIEHNIKQAEGFCREICLQGDIPIAPHVYFTRFLNDNNVYERQLGIDCGLELLVICNQINVYMINGYISEGMKKEIKTANELGIKINKIYLMR